MLSITEAAQVKFKEFLMEEGKNDAYIRIYVSGVGWGGPRYGLTLDESVQEGKDVVEEAGEVKIVFDQGIANFVEGKSVDYHDGPGGGFSITDPGKDSKCDGGCC